MADDAPKVEYVSKFRLVLGCSTLAVTFLTAGAFIATRDTSRVSPDLQKVSDAANLHDLEANISPFLAKDYIKIDSGTTSIIYKADGTPDSVDTPNKTRGFYDDNPQEIALAKKILFTQAPELIQYGENLKVLYGMVEDSSYLEISAPFFSANDAKLVLEYNIENGEVISLASTGLSKSQAEALFNAFKIDSRAMEDIPGVFKTINPDWSKLDFCGDNTFSRAANRKINGPLCGVNLELVEVAANGKKPSRTSLTKPSSIGSSSRQIG